MLHSKAGLPGIEKPCCQSPDFAAKYFWQHGMCMPTEAAEFIEDRTEDTEIEGFAGIRCIERAHVMAVKMVSKDATVNGKIGLPGHTSFAPMAAAVDGKRFQWLSFEQFLQTGGTLSNHDVKESCVLKGAVDKRELLAFLRHGGIKPEEWDDRGEDRAVRALQREMEAGKTYLEMNSSGILRVVDMVALRLWNPDRTLLLIDKGRANDFGDKEWKAQLPGRKKEMTKTLREVAIAIAEILNCSEDDIQFPAEMSWEYSSYQSKSERYKGLPTKYCKFFVDAVLEDEEEVMKNMGLITTSNDWNRVVLD
jgi:hypothetical protein